MPVSSKGPVILIVGTRPEGIKMMPLYFALRTAGFDTQLCSTMQHDELLTEVFDVFDVKPDYDLKIMRLGQDLFYLTQSILQKTKEIFMRTKPSLVVVQGDTTSAMAASLAAFYLGIPVAHVEAGLRTDDIYSPFPEEMNRRFIGVVAQYHFAPTSYAAANLLAQGAERSRVFCTGNTVVDALRLMQDQIVQGKIVIRSDLHDQVLKAHQQGKKIIILTAHRRESFDGGITRILCAVKDFLASHPDVICFYPFHPNPHVLHAIKEVGLSCVQNIVLMEPISYKDMVYLLLNAHAVVTDSGGIQEEAVSLGKPVLVLREKTERMEGVWAGVAHMVGTDISNIIATLQAVLLQKNIHKEHTTQVYGDGYAAQKIVTILQSVLGAVGYREQLESGLVNSNVDSNKEDMNVNKICMIGLGYIGLPTAIVASEHGYNVMGYDVDQARVNGINNGDPVIHEPEIFEKLQVALGSGRFKASTTITQADYFIIAVPTPFKGQKLADLSYVYSACDAVAKVLAKGNVVILESTIPVGTTHACAQYLAQKTGLQAGSDFYIAHCPERVLPGKIFQELIENDRIIGGLNQASVQQASAMYKKFVRGNLYLTDATTAEMVKLVENSSRDVQIAFANQVASMAYSVGLNPFEVIELANKHPRVDILKPGCGVGGHCIAVDPWFLVESFPEQTQLLKAARQVNDNKPYEVLQFVRKAVVEWQKNNTGRCTVAAFGLTYKPDVDDLRESPALHIAQELQQQGDIDLLVCEPYINKSKLAPLFGDNVVIASQALERAHVVLFLVPHTRFKALDQKLLQSKKILDVCGMLYEPKNKSDCQEHMFWPARSASDFFVLDTQHDLNLITNKDASTKEESA